MTDRTERVLQMIERLRERIDAAQKGSVTIHFSGHSLSVQVTEVMENQCPPPIELRARAGGR